MLKENQFAIRRALFSQSRSTSLARNFMHYLITGGAGFIGSAIVEELLKRGERVRIIDNFSTGFRENIAHAIDKIEVVDGDIRNFHTVLKAVQGVDCILHEAALPSVPRSIQDPVSSNQVNVDGTLNVLWAAKESGVKRVVFASSSSVYGDTPVLPKQEDMTPGPLSPYAVSKLAGEQYFKVFAGVYGMQTVALRYFNVFGPRQNPNSQYSAVIPKFITAMLGGKKPVIFGDGTQSRDFTFVANVVEANIRASKIEGNGGVVMNCACHGQISLNELVDRLNVILGTTLKPEYKDTRPGDIKHSFASIDRMKSVLGFEPGVDFETGLRTTCEFYKQLMKSGKTGS
jgi:nucleoside-diphosphate-sugar epimerase